MFEVGKEYHKKEHKDFRAKCIWADNLSAVLEITHNARPLGGITNVGARVMWAQCAFFNWTEYKEPIKIVRYFNVHFNSRRDLVAYDYDSRKRADVHAGPSRVSCKRVEFTEGEFDD